MGAWIAQEVRTTVIVSVAVIVAAYAFYYLKNDIAPSMYVYGLGLRHPARPRRPRRRHR
jgi:hypothetical protein